MPLPAWLVSGIILGLTNYLRKEVFSPRGTSVEPKPNWNDNTRENPNPPSKPPTIPPQIDPTPINFPPVYVPPKKPYTSPSYDSNNNPPVTKPPSRLPVEEDGQTATQTGNYAGVSLQQAIENRNYGALLHSPFSSVRQEVRIAVDPGLLNKMNEAATQGMENFTKWLAGKPEATLYDAIALVVPEAIKGWQGNLGLIMGIEPFLLAADNYSDLAQNARMGVSDTVPKEYQVKTYTPKAPTQKLDSKLLGLISHFKTFDLLGGNFFGQQLKVEDWLKAAVPLNFEGEDWEQQEVKIETIPQLIRHVATVTYFRLGLGDLPFTLPENLIQDLDGNAEEKTIDTHSMAGYQLYLLQALDSVFGQFPIKIRIEDNDLIQTGNQDIEIKLPNLAETLAEMVGQNLSQQAFTKALLEIALRNLAETGQTKQQTIQTYYAALANQEYLGYKVKQKAKDVEFLFDPSVVEEDEEDQSLSRALKNKTLKVAIDEFDDDETLEGQMKVLVEAARIIKGRFWRGIDLKGNAAEAIASIIKNAVGIGEQSGEDVKEELEQFFESVEKGFADKSALLDPTKPYNKDYDRRPRIKKLDGDTP